jgi:tRNA 2-selenouridine synthase
LNNRSISVRNFIDTAQSLPIIDVRSPTEFQQGHIPEASNLPLFNDEERAEIGTIYKHDGHKAAVKQGLEIVGPKMRWLVERAEKIAPGRKILIHCWRGGMRSSSLGWLLEMAGFEAQTLKKGYKAFRNFILDQFDEKRNICVLSGYTGSGKTDILYALRDRGEQMIDLESLANHEGSVFGYLGKEKQPTGEQFQNRLGMALYQTKMEHPLWLEDESRFIGRRQIPHRLFNQMQAAPVFRINVPKEERINRLVKDYANYPINDLKESILKIKKRLGGLKTQQGIETLEAGNVEKAADLVLYYYDKAYDRQLQKREEHKIYTLSVSSNDPVITAKSLHDVATAQAFDFK